jgi:hypothetical protein
LHYWGEAIPRDVCAVLTEEQLQAQRQRLKMGYAPVRALLFDYNIVLWINALWPDSEDIPTGHHSAPSELIPHDDTPSTAADKSEAQRYCEAEGYKWPPGKLPEGLKYAGGRAVSPGDYQMIKDVARLRWEGKSRAEAAQILSVSESTIRDWRRKAVELGYLDAMEPQDRVT